MFKTHFERGLTQKLVVFLLLMIGFVPIYAQKNITGKVIDEKGEPLIGATILVVGSTTGVITDFDGNFTLQVKPGDELNISSIGYATQRVKVNGKESLQIVMVEDSELLDEVVVVGYGTMKKKDLTGSVKSISNATLKSTGQNSTLGALRGQTAGVNVTQNNGKLGTGYNIEIRGMNSINKSSSPLCVIDGVIGGDINAINPVDIERIDILKDVSATAIYGSRGSNGVIIVTTKSGQSGKTVVTYDGMVGFTTPMNLPEMFNGPEYVAYAKEAINGGSNHNPFVGREKENADNGNFTDWLDYTLQNGFQTSHSVSLTGGSEKEKHIMSVGYVNQTGSIEGEQMERFTLKLGIEGKVGNFTLGLSVNARYGNIDNGSREALRSAFRLRPIASPNDVDGNRQFYVQDYRPERFTNPLYDAENEVQNSRQLNGYANFFINYKIMDGLTVRSTFSPYAYFDRFGYAADTFTKSNKGTALPKADLTNNNGYSYTWDNTVNFARTIHKDHSIDVMLGTSTYEAQWEHSYISVKDLPFNSKWHNIKSAGTEVARESWEGRDRLVSFMGRFNYSYKDKYLFTVTGRADGSSKLAQGHKWGFFPSAAIAWRVTEEGFLKDNSVINNLKLRLSYGESGNNAVDNYSTILGTSSTQYDFDGTNANGQYLNRIKNDKLGWEKSKEINLGLDFALWGGRLAGNVELYNKKTYDLILSQKIPQTNGFDNVGAVNVGATRNKGLEIGLNTVNIQTKDFSWTTNLSFATNKNEITEIFGDSKDYPDQKLFIGQPVLVHYDYAWDGIWQTSEKDEVSKYGRLPGAVKEVDQDNSGTITPDKDRVILGTPFPDWTGSITNTFTYKDFDFSVFIYTRQGEMKWSKFHTELQNEYLGEINQLKVDYWTPENPSNTFYRPGFNGGNTSLLCYKKTSFVRVGNMTLGYNMPLKWLKNCHISKMRLYVTAINPFIFTNYTGLDPEFGANATNGSGNADNTATYNGGVSVSSYQFGINVTF